MWALATHTVVQARLWDAKTGKIVRTLPGHAGSILCVHLDEKNRFLLTGSTDTTVRLWNVETGQLTFCFVTKVWLHVWLAFG
jgi:WD40 repeat protein